MTLFPSLKTDIAPSKRPVVNGVHKFFNDRTVHPNSWTPIAYANYSGAYVWDQYEASLALVKRSSTTLSAFAAHCLSWVKDGSNKPELEYARVRLLERVAAESLGRANNAGNLKDSLDDKFGQHGAPNTGKEL